MQLMQSRRERRVAEGIENAGPGFLRTLPNTVRLENMAYHFTVVGFIFWTTDVMPNEFGYHGPIHFLVGMDTHGIIQGVVMDYNSEPYVYFSVDPPKFVEQFKNKSIRDPFQVGRDIAAVSRASITMNHAARVLRDSTRTMAKTFLTPDQIKPQQ